MAGTFGFEMNPALLSSEEKEEIRTMLATYRRHQELIREGDYYRLSDPFQEEVAAWMSVAKDQSQALVSVVRLSAEGNPFGTYVKLKGLDAESFYLEETTGHVYSGMTLMQAGLLLPMAAAEYEAYQFSFKKMKEAADLYDVLRNKISAERNVISIFGGSGSGKTTLMNIIGCLDLPTSGSYELAGQDVLQCKDRELADVRLNSIGFVFQSFHLLPRESALENVALPLIYAGVKKPDREKRAAAALDRVGLADRVEFKPTQLSGGQKQRVAIARALANDPNVLLCDEATSALDPQTTKAILQLLKHLNETLGITVVIITHEMAVVKEICHRVAVMEHGKVVESGEVFNIFANPREDITKNFIHTTSNLRKIEELIAEDSPVVKLNPGELIVRLSYIQRNVSEPLISTVSRKFDIVLNIIFSDIAIVQNAPIGGTVAIISGGRDQITQAIAYLSEKNVGVEVIKDARVSE